MTELKLYAVCLSNAFDNDAVMELIRAANELEAVKKHSMCAADNKTSEAFLVALDEVGGNVDSLKNFFWDCDMTLGIAEVPNGA